MISIRNIIKSILLGAIITIIFLLPLMFITNGEDGLLLFLGIAIISTIIFCTYTILDAIDKKNQNR